MISEIADISASHGLMPGRVRPGPPVRLCPRAPSDAPGVR